jgi:hypothetical protein
LAENRTPQDVMALIKGFLDGSDAWAWDDFECVPIADPYLETVRQRAIPMGPPDANIEGIEGLLAELRSRFPELR